METYLVGGAVRDKLLGRPVVEKDYVVVGSTEEEMIAAGFRSVEVARLDQAAADQLALGDRLVARVAEARWRHRRGGITHVMSPLV